MPTNNWFAVPDYYEHVIMDRNDRKIGTLRVKPSGVLWKPVNQQKFYSISLEEFISWITDSETGARMVSR